MRVYIEFLAFFPFLFDCCAQDYMEFKTVTVPIMGMEGADESWKTRFHVSNSKTGSIIGSATQCERIGHFSSFE